MSQFALNRHGKSKLAFAGDLVASEVEGTNFENTTYKIYRTVGGKYVASLEIWNGRMTSFAPDGTLECHAEVVKGADEAIRFFSNQDHASPTVTAILVEAGLIANENVE